jgi:hypothetical protein
MDVSKGWQDGGRVLWWWNIRSESCNLFVDTPW